MSSSVAVNDADLARGYANIGHDVRTRRVAGLVHYGRRQRHASGTCGCCRVGERARDDAGHGGSCRSKARRRSSHRPTERSPLPARAPVSKSRSRAPTIPSRGSSTWHRSRATSSTPAHVQRDERCDPLRHRRTPFSGDRCLVMRVARSLVSICHLWDANEDQGPVPRFAARGCQRWIDFTSRNSSKPNAPRSRPIPELL
jgi:hypothetical protein